MDNNQPCRPPGGIPRPPGGIPRPPGGIPRPPGGIPRPAGGIPRPAGGIPRPAGGIPRPAGGIPRAAGGIPRSDDAGRPQTLSVQPLSSGLRPPQSLRPGPSGMRAPSQLRPPQASQRSSSVPPKSSGISQPSIYPARSGGQIPSTSIRLAPPAASSTMLSMGQSFAPQFSSSRREEPSRIVKPPPKKTTPGVCPSTRKATKSTAAVESKVRESLINKSILKPGQKVAAKAKMRSESPATKISTPAGQEPLLQKAVLEKRVQRDSEGQSILKTVAISDLNDDTGRMENVALGIMELDPKYAKMDGNEVIGVTSAVTVTPQYTTMSKDFVRAVTESDPGIIGMSPEEVAQLIEEEKEDINNTLKMMPPDLILEPGKYELKHRLQQMRLNSESVALLEQSIIQPEATADHAQEELSPEAIATVMYTVETGIKPEASPDQVFNSLFQEPPNEHFINLSSISPGPLQDVVVPTDVPKDIHKEVVTTEMTKLTEKFNNTSPDDIPTSDIFSKVMEDDKKNPEQGKNNPRKFPLITDEKSLWVNANLEHLVNIVGAEPADVIDPFNLEELEKSGNLETELANGVEYFVETNPIQYMNRVQLRGSQEPCYFPGFMVAVPDFPDIIKVVKSPDEVFSIAWKSVQPKYFEDESMLSILS